MAGPTVDANWVKPVPEFDYIIVGAGSAGCVLAERLSRNGRYTVALIEAGGRGRSPWISLPIGYGKTFFDQALNWKYQTEAEDALAGRAGYWPRGKCVGGSGAINALVYARGLAHDFDDWEASGATGWNWQVVRKTYEAMETQVASDGTQTGSGPIHVQDVSDQIHVANRHFFGAVEELGLPQTGDINADGTEGGAVYRINTSKGRRMHSARAYLRPAMARGNVHLFTGSQVQRILFDGRRATGVTVHVGGQQKQITAGQEVILSAGAIGSPHLLQLSGIGPTDLLRKHGVDIVAASPNVGENLQDHLGINYYFRATEPTLNNALRPWYGKLKAGLQYALRRQGPLALSVNQCGGYFRSQEELKVPDQQLYFNPVTYTTTPDGKREVIQPDPFAGFILGFQPSRPTSRGRIALRSANPTDHPLISPGSLSTEIDRQQVIAGGLLCQRLARTAALGRLIKSSMDPDLLTMTADEILTDFRQRCGTVFHPVGTCRMGKDAASSVVCPELKVHGLAGLRVIDASVFPNITSGNTNAPTMMLANRAADIILETA